MHAIGNWNQPGKDFQLRLNGMFDKGEAIGSSSKNLFVVLIASRCLCKIWLVELLLMMGDLIDLADKRAGNTQG